MVAELGPTWQVYREDGASILVDLEMVEAEAEAEAERGPVNVERWIGSGLYWRSAE